MTLAINLSPVTTTLAIIITCNQCCGSMTFWDGSGSGSADPCLWLIDTDPDSDPDPDPSSYFRPTIFSAYYFLKLHLHHFSNIKSQKESQNSIGIKVYYYFCMMMEGFGSGSRAGTGSVPLTSGSGSGRPKNMWIRWIRIWIRWIRIWIRIRNTACNNNTSDETLQQNQLAFTS